MRPVRTSFTYRGIFGLRPLRAWIALGSDLPDTIDNIMFACRTCLYNNESTRSS